jgi:catechol 2,3-dioxygenase-like lactoylglutathione lyase family enzyme
VIIKGLTFVGTSTDQRPEMAAFLRDMLGLTPVSVEGVEADLFDMPDGTSFAVASAGGMGAERTIGLLVDDVEQAAAELRAAGIETDPSVSENDRHRYIHFRAPDGQLYELVENR